MDTTFPSPNTSGGESEDVTAEGAHLLENPSLELTHVSSAWYGLYDLPRNVILCGLLFFFAEMYELIIVAPITSMFERSICRTYYKSTRPDVIENDGPILEELCKISPVQRELAMVKGWKSVFDGIPVFLLALPFGRCAEKFGPTKVLATSFVGLAMSLAWTLIVCSYPNLFSIRHVWLSSIFLSCGGGMSQVAAMTHLLASGFAGKQHTSRSFYFINVAYLFDEMLAQGLASTTMDISLWISFGFAFGFLAICALLSYIIPDPRTETKRGAEHDIGSPEVSHRHVSTSIVQHFRRSRKLIGRRKILLTLPAFFFGMFRPALLSLILQFASFRFSWKISEVARMLCVTSIINIILFLFAIPHLLHWLRTKYSMPSPSIDIALVQCSLLATGIGCMAIGFAPSILVLSLAVATFMTSVITRPPLLAFVTVAVAEHERSSLYGALQIIENAGVLIADPILQNTLAQVIQLSSMWKGMPFLIAAVFYGMAFLSMAFVNA